MDIVGAKHPFFEVAWRRYATVASCVIWTLFEWFIAHSPFWGVIAAGITGLAAYELILNYKPKPKDAENDAKP
jgi:hypothetical protein